MKRYITLAILFFLVFTNCGSDMIVVNPIALKLKKLETKKFINQIEEKEAVFSGNPIFKIHGLYMRIVIIL